MDAHYHDPTDKKYGADLRRGAGDEFAAYMALVTAAGREDGVVPRKYRELISIGVALTTQCAYCLETHVNAAKESGATPEEVAETVFVAAAMRAGGAVAHGRLAMKLYERLRVETAPATS